MRPRSEYVTTCQMIPLLSQVRSPGLKTRANATVLKCPLLLEQCSFLKAQGSPVGPCLHVHSEGGRLTRGRSETCSQCAFVPDVVNGGKKPRGPVFGLKKSFICGSDFIHFLKCLKRFVSRFSSSVLMKQCLLRISTPRTPIS
jgi:hypothetical protein